MNNLSYSIILLDTMRLMGFAALAAEKAPLGLFLIAASNPISRLIPNG